MVPAASQALVPITPVREEPVAPSPAVRPEPAFAAQLIGQNGQARGLKGGAPVLDAARSTYLNSEHSGAHDRRPAPGLVKRTDA